MDPVLIREYRARWQAVSEVRKPNSNRPPWKIAGAG